MKDSSDGLNKIYNQLCKEEKKIIKREMQEIESKDRQNAD